MKKKAIEKKTEPKVTAQRVKKLVNKWMRIFDFPKRYKIYIRVNETAKAEKKAHRNCQARVTASPGYQFAEMVINAYNIGPKTDPLELVIVHEMVHVVLWPLRGLAAGGLSEALENTFTDIDEEATTRISRALVTARGI